jgi:hypothetical protein
MTYYSLPFELTLILAQISPSTWFLLVQADSRLARYAWVNKSIVEDNLTITVRKDNSVYTKLPNGMTHKNGDLPAIIYHNNQCAYYKYGKLHRDGDQPSLIYTNAHYWYQYGQAHRDCDLPAVVYSNNRREWYQHGNLHRDGDNPALITSDGSLMWYQHGKLHRDGDNPAVIKPDGTLMWYQHGNLHRDNGPSIVNSNVQCYVLLMV